MVKGESITDTDGEIYQVYRIGKKYIVLDVFKYRGFAIEVLRKNWEVNNVPMAGG